jgi:hypothetical protein
MVPTRDEIFNEKRYFSKITRLIRKKPCNMAAVASFKNMMLSFDHAESEPFPDDRKRQKIRYAEKEALNRYFRKRKDI